MATNKVWRHSPESLRRGVHDRDLARLVTEKDDDKEFSKSFTYGERRSLWTNKAEEKMDMLWEDFNEELPRKSQSLRFEFNRDSKEKKAFLLSEESSTVSVEREIKSTKKKKSPNMVIRVLKKLHVLKSSSQRSPTKTHPQ